MKTIRYYGKEYEVVLTDDITCEGCAFHNRRCCPDGSSHGPLCFDISEYAIFNLVKR